ncbi:MAG: DUF4065 domain-containing protein [Amedibacillus dolichus]|mgnify:CR=1 FL=1|uniref:DUF4065 domain-containing protein n=1 Tax=Amedibacillus dolichus TaxID=31971 RepID=A0A942ZYI7_9FIRM|nr:type II toxin-antitoxin system antitoxin SocA domain-containing protein [Amedibacillus dolichus]MBS4883243.1 DUF4065 domain-containing protein [Amedibacillus dolichus]
MINAIDLAYFIITKCSRENCPISNLQLQKILFFIQRDRLRKGDWCIKDDFEAWPYGPVIPSVYEKFCSYGSMCIDEEFAYHLNKKVIGDINDIVEYLRNMDPWKLVDETHKKSGSWNFVYNDGSGYKKLIPKNVIKDRG